MVGHQDESKDINARYEGYDGDETHRDFVIISISEPETVGQMIGSN